MKYNIVIKILEKLTNDKAIFTFDKRIIGDNVWYLKADMFIMGFCYKVLLKKPIFLGFEHSKTGKIVGNYILLSSKNRIFKRRLENFFGFYATKISDGDILNLNPDSYQKNNNIKLTKWGVCKTPIDDFDVENFSLKTLENSKFLEKDGVNYADIFFDPINDDYALIENEFGYNNTAVISSVDIKDNFKIIKDDILKSGLHSSYPYSFKYNNEYYAIANIYPEGNVVAVYKRKSISEWEKTKHKIIVDGQKNLQDFSPFELNGKWFAFGSNPECNILNLYICENPFGQWKQHPNSPILMGLNGSRPAGNIIRGKDGVLYRLGQDCVARYGSAISVFKILNISEDNYEEKYIKQVEFPHEIACVHTLNINDKFAVFDYKKFRRS